MAKKIHADYDDVCTTVIIVIAHAQKRATDRSFTGIIYFNIFILTTGYLPKIKPTWIEFRDNYFLYPDGSTNGGSSGTALFF